MQQLKSNQQLSDFARSTDVGLIPTMGALHSGHSSLIKCAREKNQCVIVSIFVNPLQFNNSDDLTNYPRTLDTDLALLEQLGVDAVYLPEYADIYPANDLSPQVSGGEAAKNFEGAARPGHFDGMLAVVYRLLKQVNPSHAYFGEKDAQQLCLVSNMVIEYQLDVEIVACAIVRDADGLALSSRNALLSATARNPALLLSKSLIQAHRLHQAGENDVKDLLAAMMQTLAVPEVDIRYCAIVDDVTFVERENAVKHPSRAIIAAVVDGVHLLDNVLLTSK
ncbi:MAG: pantoate--beta-alanine ligase [Myxococcota bacterium]|jgi:pantoate--beta-alanine ligase